MPMTVPIQVIPPSQREDIRNSEGPHTIWDKCFRIKQYIKPIDRERAWRESPRALAFDQPFQIATERCGIDWNCADRVFLGQINGCNLSCPYCYLDTCEQGIPYTASQYVDAWTLYNNKHPRDRSGVLRVSGGEPMLYQSWVCEVVERFDDAPWPGFLWVDTNGTLPPTNDVLDVLSDTWEAAVCMCFKPGIVDWREQMFTARRFIEGCVETFFYWPAWDNCGDGSDLMEALEKLYAIHCYAPLRLTVIEIKLYETSRKREWQPHPHLTTMAQQVGYLQELYYMRKQTYRNWCRERYSPNELWLPSHQLRLDA